MKSMTDLTSTVTATATTTKSTVSSITASSSYPHVTHKKQSGTVILNEAAFTYYPSRSDVKSSEANGSGNGSSIVNEIPEKFSIPWTSISKHQVSPVSHARHLLRILLHKSAATIIATPSDSPSTEKKGKGSLALAYEFTTRSELERIRKDISARLVTARRVQAQNDGGPNGSTSNRSGNSKKRKLDVVSTSQSQQHPPPGMFNADYNSNSNYNHTDSDSKERQSFTSLTPTERSVTCSSILASDANLRTQHTLLTDNQLNTDNSATNNTNTGDTHVHMTEEGFWSTHARTESNQSAKIHGFVSKGLSSEIKSSLTIQITGNVSKPIQLGVEEMRQIFIMYPAVHAAYEEKVPLELSEEQFWRKYLESEYFHRDRGRMGCSAKSVGGLTDKEEKGKAEEKSMEDAKNKKDLTEAEKKSAKEEENKAAKEREESARMGAASSNDIFSRKDVELKQRREMFMTAHANAAATGTGTTTDVALADEMIPEYQQKISASSSSQSIAVGQFDLTSTAQTERGSKLLLLNSSADLHPSDDRGKKVIEKYNRHWAMVLNPDQATAGRDLTTLARQSARYALKDDNDAKVLGGVGKEFERLVGYAGASDDHVNHVRGIGRNVDENGTVQDALFEELTLNNVDAYAGSTGANNGGNWNGGHKRNGDTNGKDQQLQLQQRNAAYARFALDQVQTMIRPLVYHKLNGEESTELSNFDHSFPETKFGRELLMALTKHFLKDAMTDKDTKKMTRALPSEFRKKLTSYTRRSSELLRHFFALRHVIETEQKLAAEGGSKKKGKNNTKSSQKLKKIVAGMEGVYREVEGMRKELPQTELGEQMRKMYYQIMEQLDRAFQLNRDSSGSGSGFVVVD